MKEQIDTAIELLRAMLQADGYELETAVDGARFKFTVVAGPEACADCLVPQELFKSIAADALVKASLGFGEDDIDVAYPAGIAAGH